MKKLIRQLLILFLFTLCNGLLLAQGNASYYWFDANKKNVATEVEAAYLLAVLKMNDSCYIYWLYHAHGLMICRNNIVTKKMNTAEGIFCWHNEAGFADSIGHFSNNSKDGWWHYFSKGKEVRVGKYENGKLLSSKLIDHTVSDSANSSDNNKPFKPLKVETSFGTKKYKNWIDYVRLNLKTPERYLSIAKPGNHGVVVTFSIGSDGYVVPEETCLRTSLEWSADNTVFNLVNRSPQWKPAEQNGKKVKFRQLQHVIFVIGGE